MPRSMSTARRARIFTAADGLCHYCGGKIDGAREAWDAAHVVPYALLQDDSDENLRPAHARCHRGANSPTSADQRQIAKAKRVASKHEGSFAKSHRPLPGGRLSSLKKRVDGSVVARDDA